jgi:hypothetical protein
MGRSIAAVLLILLGIGWVIICFVGTMMMSRSVDMFTEALLPSLLSVLPIGLAWYLIAKGNGRPS